MVALVVPEVPGPGPPGRTGSGPEVMMLPRTGVGVIPLKSVKPPAPNWSLFMKGGWGEPEKTIGALGDGDLAPEWPRPGEELGLPK